MTLQAVAGGAQASGRAIAGLAVGQQADFVVLDARHVALNGLPADSGHAAHVFASHRTSAIADVWVRGQQRVQAGRHALHEVAQQALSGPQGIAARRLSAAAIRFLTEETLHEPNRPFVFHQGTAPLLISMPHTGTHVPADIAARLTPEGREVHDTDWHMPQLYDFAKALGASMLVATHSRYVIDLNRPPDGASLYPGQSVTGLCPVDGFDSKPLYASKDPSPTRRKSRAAASSTGSPITRSCAPSSIASRASMAWPCCGMRTASARCCRAFSRASCPT
jgi:hypothetical protein